MLFKCGSFQENLLLNGLLQAFQQNPDSKTIMKYTTIQETAKIEELIKISVCFKLT